MEHPGIASPWAPPRAVGGLGQPCRGAAVSPPSWGGPRHPRSPRCYGDGAGAASLLFRARSVWATKPSEALGGRRWRWGGHPGHPHTRRGAHCPRAPRHRVPHGPQCGAGGSSSPRSLWGWEPPPRRGCCRGSLTWGGSCYINTTGSISCCLVRDDGDVNGLQGAEVAFWGALELCPPLLQLCKHLLPGGRAFFGGAVP